LKKVLIEETSVELLELFDKVSEEARTEKLAIPPINKMVYWWTRKPLVVGKAIALASTLTNPKDVENLLSINKDRRAYLHTSDLSLYKKYLGQNPSEINILDPFGGAGNLIFEIKNLGLNCSVSDYNPLAYLFQKAFLDYPVTYRRNLVNDFNKFANQILEKTRHELNKFYDINVLTYFWVWCIKCPHCKQRLPLTNNMWLVKTTKKKKLVLNSFQQKIKISKQN